MKKAESAGGIVLNAKGEVALVKNGPDFWGFPKGHIDPGEEALAAAIREIEEETGIKDLTLVREYPVYTRTGGRSMSELKSIKMYLFTTEAQMLAPQDKNNPEARWIVPDEVEKFLSHPKDKEFFRGVDISILPK